MKIIRKDKSVKTDRLQPCMRPAIKTVCNVYAEYGQTQVVVTAGNECWDKNGIWIHSPGSLHPYGLAVDIRTNVFSKADKFIVYKVLRDILKPLGFDVVMHSTHFHIEYDPDPLQEKTSIPESQVQAAMR